MSNSSLVPAPGMDGPRRTETGARPAVNEGSRELPKEASKVAAVTPSGPRKLVRPTLASRGFEGRYFPRRPDTAPVLAYHNLLAASAVPRESSHAEAFYFQKQVQAQTLMVFVLEGGEQIEGYIEWFDRNCVKVRHGSRTLIYKSSIKYLYKAGDNARTV